MTRAPARLLLNYGQETQALAMTPRRDSVGFEWSAVRRSQEISAGLGRNVRR